MVRLLWNMYQKISSTKKLCNLNTGKSTDWGGIPAKFLRDATPFIKLPVTFLINMSIFEGIVPDEL